MNNPKNMLSGVMDRARGVASVLLRRNPLYDWLMGLIVALLIVIACGLYATLVFSDVTATIEKGGSVDVGIAKYQHDAVRGVLEVYRERKAKFQTLEGGVLPTFPGPSPKNDSASAKPNVAGGAPVQVE